MLGHLNCENFNLSVVLLLIIHYLEKNTKVCYTYDDLLRVTVQTVKNLDNEVQSEESFAYDAAGNITERIHA